MDKRPEQTFLWKMTYRWPTNTWKDAQHHLLLEKCKLKLQCSVTSHKSKWPSSKKSTNNKCRKYVEKREPSWTVSRNVNWHSHYGKQYGDSFKKLEIKLSYHPAIPLWGIYPEKIIIQKDTCTPLSIVAVYTVAKT